MRRRFRTHWRPLVASFVVLALTALPAFAQEQSAPDPADSTAGTIFRWLNFIIVMAGILYLVRKAGAPYFRQNAQNIGQSIRHAAEERAAAQRALQDVTDKLAKIDSEIRELRRAAAEESAAQAERIRALAQTEVERIKQAARAEITASERAASAELRAATARLATEHAAVLVRAQMNTAAESALFRSFLQDVERSAT